ncbi:PMT family glycosyltransferase, 4-amino-4-deoxy-L-arabinose transferase [Galbibacter orientalis DSM 19592]|uniref:PMT family glycosyltransferase, 4-amino-4-deoxy-L-arabinose transferase n=1 Tax=Galbibacter orientalis DSM 19592 TaxID=926559 RepID=I3C6S0_9FLAO|nr:glycosyltransferase family 39 protein [Galbibacter orientalis]EIJ39313.1 PMT family glycosyltransferase, 4-amino-4-deoxy-L-arabinose transferase [Galbibacter orientalis DSM 19592]
MTLKNSTDRYYLLFLFIAFLILIIGLGSYGLAETSEARYAEISREMLLNGDYLNPELLGIFHFHKPPITYYITTLGYQIFGVNEFGARFFLQVAIIIQLLLIYRLAYLLYKDKRIAFIAGLVYFSFPIVLISSRNLTTDAFLTTFILGAIYCWQVYDHKNKTVFLYFFYTLVGVALLTKGPVALLFVLAYIITRKLIYGDGAKITNHHVIGFVLCALIGASWYIAVIMEHPKIWDYFINKQLAGRMTGNAFKERSKPFWYYFPILLGLLLPWCLSLISNFKKYIKSFFAKQKETKVLIYSSAILFFLFSAFSTKLILYILPIFWMVAIIIAVGLPKISNTSKNIVNLTYASLLTMLFVGLVFSWIFKTNMENVSIKTLIVALISLIIFGLVYHFIENEKFYKPPVLAATFGGAIILISTSFMSHNSPVTNSTKDMVKFIDNVSNERNKTILVYDYLLSSIPFYTNDTLITLKYSHHTTQRETQFENNDTYKQNLWDMHKETEINKLSKISKKHSTYLLVRNKRDLDKKFSFLKENFDSEKHYQKWTLYYHK